MFVAHFDNILDGFVGQNLTGGVAWVDDDHSARANSISLCDFDLLIQVLRVQPPVQFFVQVIRNQVSLQQSQECRVKWVLRDWHQYAVVAVADCHLQSSSAAFRSAVSDKDVIRVHMVKAITLCDEISHRLASVGPAFAICSVSSNWRLLVRLIIVDSVFGVVANHVRVHERRVHEAGDHLAVESDVALATLLRVTDVQECGFFKIVFAWLASFEILCDFLTADRDCTTNSVLSFEDVVSNGSKCLLVPSERQLKHFSFGLL